MNILYNLRYFWLTVLPVLLLAGCAQKQEDTDQPIKKERLQLATNSGAQDAYPHIKSNDVKNIILFIGDGNGLAQNQTAQLALVGKDGKTRIQRMPVTGLIKTYSADNLITDSAAGATAFATGHKTRNGMISMSADSLRLTSLLELLKKQGKSTGLVSTSSITHATPASFASHVVDRDLESEIALQLVNSGADVMLGGGRQFFLPDSVEGSERSDNRDLLALALDNGYDVATNADELSQQSGEKLLGLFSMDALGEGDNEPTLQTMTKAAVERLSKNEQGFFLMVEGSQIDWAGHDNDLQYMLDEYKDFDDAVGYGIDWAAKDKSTLVLATADHETGGLTLYNSTGNPDEIEIAWTTTHHTGIQVPLFAFGPKAMEFTGMYDNTDVADKMAALLGIKEFPVQPIADN